MTTWSPITDAYYAVLAKDMELLRELIPSIGKARSPSTIAHRHFWRALELIYAKFPNDRLYHIVRNSAPCPPTERPSPSCCPAELVDRFFLRHEATGSVFCLGTRFSTWRVYGPKAAAPIADELAIWLGFAPTAPSGGG